MCVADWGILFRLSIYFLPAGIDRKWASEGDTLLCKLNHREMREIQFSQKLHTHTFRWTSEEDEEGIIEHSMLAERWK